MKLVEIYTDGACSGNPGIGGWCAILLYNGNEKAVSGGSEMTTNNRMEIYAAIGGLRSLKEKCIVTLYSDSAYLVNSVNNGWLTNWQNNNWVKSGSALKNQDLWREFLELFNAHIVTMVKVKGHSDNLYNNKCDLLARLEIEKIRKTHITGNDYFD